MSAEENHRSKKARNFFRVFFGAGIDVALTTAPEALVVSCAVENVDGMR